VRGRWAENRPGEGSPFSFFSFLAPKQNKTSISKINKIKQKLCSSMNAKIKHVSTLYFILINFVNYLIILQKFKLSQN
jgi:hypothetical protein